MKKFLFTVALFTTFAAIGQHICGTQHFIEKRISENPDLKADYDAMLQSLHHMQQKGVSASRNAKKIIYVPVVFHVIHDGDAYGQGENITDEQILSQIDALNRDFSLSNSDTSNIPPIFKPLAANTYIQFCMARFDPQGNPTNGIDRIQFNKASWDTENEIETQLKPSTIWDRSKYMNIWVCRFGGTLQSGGTLAYATLPFFTNNNTDGIVSRFNVIGTTGVLQNNYRLGRTIVHEVGHWLGLLHVWGNTENSCDNGSWGATDFIDDTPDQFTRYFGCPSHPQTSCNSQDMFNNYMDYTNDDCKNMFSIGQSDRMYEVLTTQNQRGSFQTAVSKCYLALDAALPEVLMPTDTICRLSFNPTVKIKNEGFTPITSGNIVYKLNNDPPQTLAWSGRLDVQESAYVTLPEFNLNEGNHVLSVAFDKPNGINPDDDPFNDGETINFYAYQGGFSTPAPFMTDFEDGFFPPFSWDIENGGTISNTWVSVTNSGYGNGSFAAMINNLNYTSNPNRAKDALITEDYNLSSVGLPRLSFDYAYARHSNNRFDSLVIYYSLDCGKTWNQIYRNGGALLATAPDKVTLFTPGPNEWKTIDIDLPQIMKQNQVRFKFENVSGWGNALYLDNINIAQSPVSVREKVQEKVEVKVFPNPASSEALVSLPMVHPFTDLEVYNAIGQRMMKLPVTQRVVQLNTADLPVGTYFIRLFSANANQQHSIIIAR